MTNLNPPASNAERLIQANSKIAEPIELAGLQLDGCVAEPALEGQTVKIWTKLAIISDLPMFHQIVQGITNHISYCAADVSHIIDSDNVNLLLLIIRPDNTGQLWLNNLPIIIKILVKRSMEAGETVYQQDIADIVAMSFPQVPVAETDRIIVLFRKKYRFGLFFDFNRQGLGSIAKLEQELGTLYRQLSYHNVYDALANSDTFQKVIQSGWFPFVEIINAEFDQFLKHQESGFDIELFEKEIIKAFDDQRLESMFNRWMAKPHFKDKSLILRSAIDSYRSGNSIAVLKTVLTEIEGIIREAYRSVHNKSAKLDALLDFAVKSAELRTGAANTLFFPTAFAQYLQSHMNANFDPVNKTGTASSRHAVGHGAADQNSYTMANALKSLLTLDQLYFYT